MRQRWNSGVKLICLLVIPLFIAGDFSSGVKLNRFQFFLGDPTLKPLTRLIKQADRSITVGMYHIVDPKYKVPGRFAHALVDANERGVNVNVAIERRDKWTRPTIKFFKEHDVDVRFYQNQSKIQHIKAIVVDEKYVFIGSQNISGRALSGKNWEAGVIYHSPPLASRLKTYLQDQR